MGFWGFGVTLVLVGSGSPSSGGGTLRARWLGPGPQVPFCTPVTVATGGAGVQKNAETGIGGCQTLACLGRRWRTRAHKKTPGDESWLPSTVCLGGGPVPY